MLKKKNLKKSNLLYTGGFTPKRATSDRDISAAQRLDSTDMSKRRRAVGDIASNLTSPLVEPMIHSADSDVFNHSDNLPIQNF